MSEAPAADNPAENPYLMSDEAFEALEEILTSDVVPEDCMDLEMLDGFLAGVLLSPRAIPVERWLPAVWSAHEDSVGFGSGSGVQRAIRLVLSYYNEMATTLGLDEEEEACWEPFCFAIADGDTLKLGDEWIEGFAQGLELWPQDWEQGLSEDTIEAVQATLDEVLAPWRPGGEGEADADGETAPSPADGDADDETRLGWLAAVGEGVNDIFAHWREVGLPTPSPVAIELPQAAARSGPGRNDPCPCGSGKKFKKCCGAEKA
ncbi:MAG: YecA family protein [Betaproteobacteria bacterium]|nr:MAG: YecA family protein [Betaproteobacteria bacterium]